MCFPDEKAEVKKAEFLYKLLYNYRLNSAKHLSNLNQTICDLHSDFPVHNFLTDQPQHLSKARERLILDKDPEGSMETNITFWGQLHDTTKIHWSAKILNSLTFYLWNRLYWDFQKFHDQWGTL